ncbi:hypothetical protein AKJ41_00845 [candidate division MSBL1 archaeon SCGC-AAA259O05]|uniref:Uncharacterized protein n=1 Tax=candidate division MSBL1 archaeon SCGC-AAA259O05 TaxID=1698271 RepID=A0A133V5A4_9EURY|nr:hypothetical protein AKJ41_00845 [candidate division MSBL1 archaeon SCGC-AAA259O05]
MIGAIPLSGASTMDMDKIVRWTKSEINHIKVSLGRCNAQQLANELGRAKENVERKIREIEIKERLARLSTFGKKENGSSD